MQNSYGAHKPYNPIGRRVVLRKEIGRSVKLTTHLQIMPKPWKQI
jgi:hypothetical protein